VQDVLSHFFLVVANKFFIGPDSELRTVDLVHDESHEDVHNAVNDTIDLVESITVRKELRVDIGSKDQAQ
jgi:hypothetical protein